MKLAAMMRNVPPAVLGSAQPCSAEGQAKKR